MTKKELAFRTALLFSGSIISNAFSGLISAGLLKMDGLHGVRGWQWLFIIEASLTGLAAIAAFFILPDFPENSAFLTIEERALAVARLTADAGGEADVESKGKGAKEGVLLALQDTNVYLLMAIILPITTGLSFNLFFPTLTGTLGYGQTNTLLLTVPPWTLAALVSFFNGRHADYTGERFLHISVPLVVGIVGFTINASTMNTAARFVGLFLQASSYATYAIVLSWISNTIPRPMYKRSVALAAINSVAQFGNVAGSYIWSKDKYGPRYWQSNLICATMFLTAIGLAGVLRWRLVRKNRKLDRRYGTVAEILAAEGGRPTAETTRMKFRFVL